LRRVKASAILHRRGAVAQPGERLNGIEEVGGSSPPSSTITTLSPIVNTAHTPYNVNIVVKTWWERW
jgi:hypothetical protein